MHQNHFTFFNLDVGKDKQRIEVGGRSFIQAHAGKISVRKTEQLYRIGVIVPACVDGNFIQLNGRQAGVKAVKRPQQCRCISGAVRNGNVDDILFAWNLRRCFDGNDAVFACLNFGNGQFADHQTVFDDGALFIESQPDAFLIGHRSL